MKLSADQRAAITAATDAPPAPREPFLLTGNAGMGKTTIAHAIVSALPPDLTARVLYVAESNKAVSVLRSKLPTTAMTATVCSAAYRFDVDKKRQLDEIESQLAEPGISYFERSTLLNAKRALADNPDRIPIYRWRHPVLGEDTAPTLVVLDEGSMINSSTRAYLDSLGVPMLIIGDWAQLPPIDGDPGYRFRTASDATLTTCHRTDVPRLVRLWDRARAIVTDPDADLLPKHGWLADRDTLRSLLKTDAVITGRRVTHAAITFALRAITNRPLHTPVPGDVLMASANGPGVTKGDFRTVARVRPTILHSKDDKNRRRRTKCYTITFTDGSTTLAETYGFYRPWLKPEQLDAYAPSLAAIPTVYDARRKNPPPYEILPAGASALTSWEFGQVITCHKAQGSQWPRIAVIDESMCWREQAGEWAYTAVSRASHNVKIYGPPRKGSDIFHFSDH